jgi:hypothetical protein
MPRASVQNIDRREALRRLCDGHTRNSAAQRVTQPRNGGKKESRSDERVTVIAGRAGTVQVGTLENVRFEEHNVRNAMFIPVGHLIPAQSRASDEIGAINVLRGRPCDRGSIEQASSVGWAVDPVQNG